MFHGVAARANARGRGDQGETLIEMVIAVAIIGLTAVALIGSVLTSITSSGEHRTLTLNDVYVKSYANSAQQQIQRQSNPLWQGCASSYAVTTPPSIPSTYTVGISSIKYWSGTAWSSNCPSSSAPQLITVAATSPTQISSTLSFVVRNPS